MKKVSVILIFGAGLLIAGCSSTPLPGFGNSTATSVESPDREDAAGFVDAFPGDDFGNDVGFADDVGIGNWTDNPGFYTPF